MAEDTTRNSVQTSLQELSQKLTDTIQRVITDATTLEVTTCVSADMDGVKVSRGKFGGSAKPWAQTIIGIDGDISNCFPEGELDPTLLAMHKDMIQQALKQRADMLATLSAVAKDVLGMLPQDDE